MEKNFIAGQWVESASKESTPVWDPATGEVIAQTPVGLSSDVDQAVEQAQKAFATWRQTPVVDRVQPLFRLKVLLEKHQEDVAKLIVRENGKTLVEAMGSVRRAIQMVETATGMPTFILGRHSEDIASGIDSMSIKQPMGVFAGIAPFNFPAMVPYWFWPFAVASGNTYVLKPSERVPLTQGRLTELAHEAGFPAGVFNLVHGGKEVVERLCTHPLVKGVSFVGSTPIARRVYELGTSHTKRVQALGGAKNFMVVLPDAPVDPSVKTCLESILGCAGQRCLAGSVILSVGGETYERVSQKVVDSVKSMRVGPGMDKDVDMGPVISPASRSRIEELIEGAVKEGAKLLVDGRGHEGPGFFLGPSVVADVTPEMKIAQEEIFGPVVCLGKVGDLQEAVGWINSSPFGNTASLFTNNGAAAREFSYHVDPAMLGINIGVPAPMSFFSFGGSKESFFGDIKAHGQHSVDFFTDTKTVIQRWTSEGNIWKTR